MDAGDFSVYKTVDARGYFCALGNRCFGGPSFNRAHFSCLRETGLGVSANRSGRSHERPNYSALREASFKFDKNFQQLGWVRLEKIQTYRS